MIPGLGEIEMVARGFEMFNNATAFRQLGTSIGDFARGKYGKGVGNLVGAVMQAGTGIKTHNTNITRRALNGALDSAERLEKASAAAEEEKNLMPIEKERIKQELRDAESSSYEKAQGYEAEIASYKRKVQRTNMYIGHIDEAMTSTSTHAERLELLSELDTSDPTQASLHEWLTDFDKDENTLQAKLYADRQLTNTDLYGRGILDPKKAKDLAKVRYVDEFHQTSSYQFYSRELPKYKTMYEEDVSTFESNRKKAQTELDSINRQRVDISAPYLRQLAIAEQRIKSAQQTIDSFDKSVKDLIQIQKKYSTLYYNLRIYQLASDTTSNINNYA